MHNATEKELESFNKIVGRWFMKGQMFIVPKPDKKYPERDLEVQLVFAGRGESICNINGAYKWAEVFEMVKKRGLLS